MASQNNFGFAALDLHWSNDMDDYMLWLQKVNRQRQRNCLFMVKIIVGGWVGIRTIRSTITTNFFARKIMLLHTRSEIGMMSTIFIPVRFVVNISWLSLTLI